ncbi:MAG: hypothetical protein B7Z52_07855, partial [Burkholderiales bacterium 12-64-5]
PKRRCRKIMRQPGWCRNSIKAPWRRFHANRAPQRQIIENLGQAGAVPGRPISQTGFLPKFRGSRMCDFTFVLIAI